MELSELQQNIKTYIDTKYNGSYRFLKPKLIIKTFGKDVYNIIIQKINFLEPHDPMSLYVKCFVDGVFTRPVCKMCLSNVKFNSNTGWQTYCGNTCRFEDMDHIQTIKKKTNLSKYGNTNVLASETGKRKATQTHLTKYGVKHYNQTDEYKERLQSGDITRISNPQKVRETFRRTYYDNIQSKFTKLTPLFTFEEFLEHGASSYYSYNWQCKVCNTKFERWLNMGYEPLCPQCTPTGTQHENLIKNLLTKYNISYNFRDRKQLGNGQEIDIYIPDKKIGFEINGLYYHHDDIIDKRYHIDKTERAEQHGIQLIHIFGDELIRKPKIVISRIKHILHLINRSIYARKCTVKEITPAVKTKFFNKYHIQGSMQGSIHLGLYYKNRLIAAMEFCHQRPGLGKSKLNYNDSEYELARYATISNFNIIGGAGKLLKHFIRIHKPTLIKSYADRRWSTGNLYKKLGFVSCGSQSIGYWYTKNFTERLHRIGFQTNKLKQILPNYDANLSESENMKNHKYYRIWDCGTLLYKLYI